jgi:hypothetical protein
MSKHQPEPRAKEMQTKIQMQQSSQKAKNNFTRLRNNMGVLHRRHK